MSVLPSFLIDADVLAGRIVEMLPGLARPRVPVFVAWRSEKTTTAKIAAMLDQLAAIDPSAFA